MQVTDDDIVACALAEIASPTLGVTEQFFEVHELAEAPVRLVYHEAVADAWRVYLNLKDVRYYWVVQIKECAGGLEVAGAYPSPETSVQFYIYSTSLTLEEISARMEITPTETQAMGDPRKYTRRPYERNCWALDAPLPKQLNFESKLRALLNLLMTRANVLNTLPSDCSIGISVGYHDCVCWPSGWHLDVPMVEALGQLRLELDVDLYVEGPKFAETEDVGTAVWCSGIRPGG